jgi:hypothetical protein
MVRCSELLQLLPFSATKSLINVVVHYYRKELQPITEVANQEKIKSPTHISCKSFIIYMIQQFSINLVYCTYKPRTMTMAVASSPGARVHVYKAI